MKKAFPLVLLILIPCAQAFAGQHGAIQQGVSQPVIAQPGQQQGQAFADPCREDVQRLCADITPGDGRIVACLKSKEDKLSPACKARFDEGKKRLEQARQACAGDVQKFCKDVQAGQGRLLTCLKNNYEGLSQECKNTFSEAMGRAMQKGHSR